MFSLFNDAVMAISTASSVTHAPSPLPLLLVLLCLPKDTNRQVVRRIFVLLPRTFHGRVTLYKSLPLTFRRPLWSTTLALQVRPDQMVPIAHSTKLHLAPSHLKSKLMDSIVRKREMLRRIPRLLRLAPSSLDILTGG